MGQGSGDLISDPGSATDFQRDLGKITLGISTWHNATERYLSCLGYWKSCSNASLTLPRIMYPAPQ